MIEKHFQFRSRGKYYPCVVWADTEEDASLFSRAFQTGFDFELGKDGTTFPRVITEIQKGSFEKGDEEGYGFFFWDKKQVSSEVSQYRAKIKFPDAIFTDK